MIDLGDELADYGEQPQTPPKPPDGMGSFGRLTDLQAGGLDVDPRRTDTDPQQWGFNQGLSSLSMKLYGGGGAGKAGIAPGAAGASTFTPANQDGFQPLGSISGDDDAPEIEAKTWLPGDSE